MKPTKPANEFKIFLVVIILLLALRGFIALIDFFLWGADVCYCLGAC